MSKYLTHRGRQVNTLWAAHLYGYGQAGWRDEVTRPNKQVRWSRWVVGTTSPPLPLQTTHSTVRFFFLSPIGRCPINGSSIGGEGAEGGRVGQDLSWCVWGGKGGGSMKTSPFSKSTSFLDFSFIFFPSWCDVYVTGIFFFVFLLPDFS